MRELHCETTKSTIIFYNGRYKLGTYNKKSKAFKATEKLSLKELQYIIKIIKNGT